MNAAPVTKGLVVRQPWATLIALGVKTIETRPYPPNGPMRPKGVRGLPGCSLERGERIAIVAGAAAPSAYALGEFDICQHASETCHVMDGWPVLTRGDWYMYRRPNPPGMVRRAWLLPLGAVVCTVTVEDALPIRSSSLGDEPELVDGGHGLRIVRPLSHCAYGWSLDHSVADQLPLGDFTEGRWGWMLGDPQPPMVRCDEHVCSASCDDWPCGYTDPPYIPSDPIPCKGAQGVFTLPAEVAEALS